MGLFKKIFKGKKKSKEEDVVAAAPIGNPSFPSVTASESKSGGRRANGLSPSGSLSSGGSNRQYNANNMAIARYNTPSPRSMADFASPRSAGPIDIDDIDDDGMILPNTDDIEQYYAKTRNQTQEELRIAYEMSKAQREQTSLDNMSFNGDHDGELPSSSPKFTSNQLTQWDRNSNEEQQNHLHQQFSSSPNSNGRISPRQQETSPQMSYQRVYTMSSTLPSQQQFNPYPIDDMNVSESDDASSFNLSTDAEDSEYEIMKRTHMYPPSTLNGLASRLSALDTSAIDTVGSVTSYTTDEDRKIFPNLPTDDEMTLGTEASSKMDQQIPPSLLLQPMPNPLKQVTVPLRDIGQSNQNGASSMEHHSSTNSSNDSSIIKNSNMHQKTLDPAWNFAAADPGNQPTSTKSISRNKPGATPRNFTSPKAKPTNNSNFSNDGFGNLGTNGTASNTDFSNDGFGNFETANGAMVGSSKNENLKNTQSNKSASTDDSGFADFGNFAEFGEFPATTPSGKSEQGWATVKEEKKDPSWEDHNHQFFNSTASKNTNSTSAFGTDIDDAAWNLNASSAPKNDNTTKDDPFAASAVSSSYMSDTSSQGFQSPQDRSLTELLEAAKSKRKDRKSYGATRHVSRLSSGSVNSEPAITSSYLRHHHNLGNRNTSGDDKRFTSTSGNSYNSNTLSNDRPGGEGTSLSDIISSLEATERTKRSEQIRSHRSMGDAGVVATARAAKERLRERRRRERELGIGRNNSDSEDSEGHKNSESWLFDQVTGAIGPAGIAADLESLSGRSNRSKNSHGGKSQRSSSVAGARRRSRKTGSRRHRSDRSVDSHGSRTSRYSHRSTKSFLSQMSEQSRSVANDLLRLEMQLAMVGNNKDANGLPTAGVSSGASLGGTSRTSGRSGRKSTSAMGRKNNTTSAVVRRSRTTIVAPPGKLGIILANKADSKGTVVSGVRTSSVLVDRISPGDRIIAIDGEDVSRMTVSEITTIMSRKAEYERRLTILTASGLKATTSPEMRSPTQSRSSPRALTTTGDYGEAFSVPATNTSNYRRSLP